MDQEPIFKCDSCGQEIPDRNSYELIGVQCWCFDCVEELFEEE